VCHGRTCSTAPSDAPLGILGQRREASVEERRRRLTDGPDATILPDELAPEETARMADATTPPAATTAPATLGQASPPSPASSPDAPTPWRPLEAVTLDLWGTLIDLRDPAGKIERRREMLLTALQAAGHGCDVERLRAGYRAAARVIDAQIAADRRDIGPPGRWEELMRQLGVPPGAVPFEAVTAAYEDLTLEFLPRLLDGVGEAIERLAARYKLALICNTGYTGGRVLRQVLERHGVARHFQTLTFSNEFGWMKPDPRIFHHTLGILGVEPAHALHVGDMEELDVHGARAAGLYSARYLPEGDNDGAIASDADLIFFDWSEFVDLIDARQRRTA
jgi:putative hydrolase of the HAD superfamily